MSSEHNLGAGAGVGTSVIAAGYLTYIAHHWTTFAGIADYKELTTLGVAALPFFVAALLTATCTAWNGTVPGRCRRPTPPLRHCADHRPAFTLYDGAALLCCAIGALAIWHFFHTI